MVVGNNVSLQLKLIQMYHESSLRGFSGIQATVKRIKTLFFWKGLELQVRTYIKKCDICQRCKYDTSAFPGSITASSHSLGSLVTIQY